MIEYKDYGELNETNRKQEQCNKENFNDDETAIFYISHTTDKDENTWRFLIEEFINKDPIFDYSAAEQIVSNSLHTIETSESPVVYKILQFIYLILQHSKYVLDIFKSAPLFPFIESIIMNSEADDDMKIYAFDILDTFLQSLIDEPKYEIESANNIIKSLNTLISNSNEIKNPFFTLCLQDSKILFEKGTFSEEELRTNFDFYLSFIENLQLVNYSLAIQNFDMILQKLDSLYEELYKYHRHTFEFIYSSLLANDTIIVQSAINILTPIINFDIDFFVENKFIQKCLAQIEKTSNNQNKELYLTFTKSMIKFCSISCDACNQLLECDFLRRKDFIYLGYSIQLNLVKIIKVIIEKTKITFDAFIVENFNYLFNSFILSDDTKEIESILDTLYLLHRYGFQINEELKSNIEMLSTENQESEINEKATLILQEITEEED